MSSSLQAVSPFVKSVSFGVLPQHSALYLLQLDYDALGYHDDLFVQLGIYFPPTVQRSAIKRKAEFLAGRLAVSHLISRRFNVQNSYVAIGDDRSPVWPTGLIGSISHTSNTAVCLLGLQSKISLLGVDIEDRMSSQTVDDIKGIVVSAKEERRCALCLSLALNDVIAIVFSAKESLFKSLYPKVLAYFDFFAAELVSIDMHQQLIVFALTKNLCDEYREGDRFSCYFELRKAHILSYVFADQ